ncbi:hypothetical protein MPSEU_000779200 [Mayamaea pseudoterrestris]|nr:hypothetical protein MPSEU_000779200 [Mayamaea pseudoterrestris]
MSRSCIFLGALLLVIGLMAPLSDAFLIRSTHVKILVNTKVLKLPGSCNVGGRSRSVELVQPSASRTSFLKAAANDKEKETKANKLPFFLDPGTKGGAVFLSLVLFVVPLVLYNISLSMGLEMIDANRIFGVGFTVVLSLAWVSTYIFRVATKDMTYAKQLKDYENAVMQKRLEELDDDEVQALMEEVDKDEF